MREEGEVSPRIQIVRELLIVGGRKGDGEQDVLVSLGCYNKTPCCVLEDRVKLRYPSLTAPEAGV